MLDSKRIGAEVELSKIERGVPITSRSYDETYRKTNQRNVCVVARVESRLELSQLNEARVESLNSSLKLGANVESSEKLIFRVDLLLVS